MVIKMPYFATLTVKYKMDVANIGGMQPEGPSPFSPFGLLYMETRAAFSLSPQYHHKQMNKGNEATRN